MSLRGKSLISSGKRDAAACGYAADSGATRWKELPPLTGHPILCRLVVVARDGLTFS